MKRFLLLAVAALTILPSFAEAQDRREGGGNPGGQRPGSGNPGGQRPGGGNSGGGNPGQRPGGGNPGAGTPGGQRPGGGNPGQQRPTPQPGRPGGDNRPGRPGFGDNRPVRPGFGDNRPGRPGGDANRPGRPGGDFNRPGHGFHRPSGWRPPAGYWHGNNWGRPPIAWGGGYRFPNGYSYRRWAPGLFLPALLFSSTYYFTGYHSLGLYAPPYGYHWVRYGPDLLLVQYGTRRIVEVRYGVFR